MQDINSYTTFLSLFRDIFQISPNWIKPLCLIIPPAFVLGFFALCLQCYLAVKRMKTRPNNSYIALQDPEGRVYLHGDKGAPLDGIVLLPVQIQSDCTQLLANSSSSPKTEEEDD